MVKLFKMFMKTFHHSYIYKEKKKRTNITLVLPQKPEEEGKQKMKRSKCLKLTVECREAGYRAVTGVKASSVVKEWQAKALNKASNHLTVAERNRKMAKAVEKAELGWVQWKNSVLQNRIHHQGNAALRGKLWGNYTMTQKRATGIKNTNAFIYFKPQATVHPQIISTMQNNSRFLCSYKEYGMIIVYMRV